MTANTDDKPEDKEPNQDPEPNSWKEIIKRPDSDKKFLKISERGEKLYWRLKELEEMKVPEEKYVLPRAEIMEGIDELPLGSEGKERIILLRILRDRYVNLVISDYRWNKVVASGNVKEHEALDIEHLQTMDSFDIFISNLSLLSLVKEFSPNSVKEFEEIKKELGLGKKSDAGFGGPE